MTVPDQMDETTAVFEEERPRLRAVAVRMLGSPDDADDALQETWLRWSTADQEDIDKPAAWLTTVLSRICLDRLRARGRRDETDLEHAAPLPATTPDPAAEAELTESVDAALLVVLDLLSPAERLSFVLHDMFAVPFEDIASITGRTPAAVRQLASRGRRRLQDPSAAELAETKARQQRVVDAFMAAARAGEFDGLLELLDPEAVIRADGEIVRMGGPALIAGAEAVAQRFSGGARALLPVTLDGYAARVWQLRGEVKVVFGFVFGDDGRIVEVEQIAEPAVLAALDLARPRRSA